MTPEERARAFLKTCPPPDAQWYVEEEVVPILAAHFRAVDVDVREACAATVVAQKQMDLNAGQWGGYRLGPRWVVDTETTVAAIRARGAPERSAVTP